jgi:hypothetical protein
MPDRLPRVPGLAIAARYQASGGSDVGGDWYDVINLGGSRVAIVLGDVVGRGVRAASVMGQVRTAVRAYVAQDPSPAHVLHSLDRLFATFSDDELVTMFYAVVTVEGTVSYASAGHLPPFLVDADGAVEALVGAKSPPLGVQALERPVASSVLRPGSVLCVYSDGVVEHRTRSLDAGMDRLRAVLAAMRRSVEGSDNGIDNGSDNRSDDRSEDDGIVDLEAAADRVLSELVEGEAADDDASLLLVRTGAAVETARASVRSRSLRWPPSARPARAARRFLRERCAEWRVPPGSRRPSSS